MLDYEKLDAYQRSIEFVALACRMVEGLPSGHGGLADQLRRAAISVPLNIAEGSGRHREPDRARFHAIARGSAMECGAILDVLRVLDAVEESDRADGKRLLTRIVAMLTKMCHTSRSVGSRTDGPASPYAARDARRR